MKLITEDAVRNIREGSRFVLERGAILSPGAQQLLRERRVTVERPPRSVRMKATPVPPRPGTGYFLAETGERVASKPEHMTQLLGDALVPKDHPRIVFRGRLDALQADVVLAQAELEERFAAPELVEALESILGTLRQLLRSEVLDEPLPTEDIMGLTPQELRAQSHDPKRYFGVDAMTLPHRSMGVVYAHLNRLRTQARLAEEAAVTAFRERPTEPQRQILKALNRLSSAFHILMCRALAGERPGR